ncbi:hypothetical protein [Streptomyces smyrnaeus]|uniref:hypothetical protein n=1 Tax=Streptomyces smyrnaeus TaxID=1387713 RepID=UPI0036924BF8
MRAAMRCPQCGRAVLWTVTEAGKRLLVDADPDPDGNTAVYQDGTGTYRSRRPSADLPVMGWERLHKPHVATCTPATRPAPGRPAPAVLPAGVADLTAYRRKTRGRS